MNPNNNQNTQCSQMSVQIPACPCRYGYCCADCVYMSRSDYDRYGRARCGSYGQYFDPADKACSRFERR